ncbi:MAG: TRAM domain-containing protein [Aquificaceae bacterium]
MLESYDSGKLLGRTRTNRWASLKGEESLLGKVVKVRVTDSKAFSMDCELLQVIR